VPASATKAVNYEVNARRARQQFGDTLPPDHLNDKEYMIYKRLYGPAIFVDPAEDVEETGGPAEEEIIEEERPDGSIVLLRKGKDGELEEIELAEEPNVEEVVEAAGLDK
jgi:hypothetical protein